MIKEFAQKWLKKFQDPNVLYIDIAGHYFDDDCQALGFILGGSKGFADSYGSAYDDVDELLKIIDEVDDIQLLGSAIFTRWRYFTHWAYDGLEILEPENREWFIIALKRLEELA